MGKTIIILRHGQITMYGSSLTLRGNDLADKAGKNYYFCIQKHLLRYGVLMIFLLNILQ